MLLGCNEQQAKSIGIDRPADLIGKSLWEIGEMLGWDIGLVEELRRNDLEVMRTGKTINVEEKMASSDGKLRTFLSKKAPLKDEEGNCIGMLGLAFDITERKEIENKLVEAKLQAEKINRAKSDFIANISHDLRTPLHTVLGTAELLKLKPHLPEQEEHIDAVIQSGETLLKLVENILNFSKLEQGEITLNNEPFNLKALIEDAVTTLGKQACEKSIEIFVNYSELIPRTVSSDVDAIRRILINLLGNAIKFTDEGQIVIAVEPVKINNEDLILNLIVKDTGIGIPKSELKLIFDRFYRVDPSYKGKYKGTGLGLAITKKLIDNLKGHITVESEPGVGTKFTCTLRVQHEAHASETTTNDDTSKIFKLDREQKLSVLLVEDVPLIQNFSINFLETMGCDVTLAINGKEAIELAKNHFDLIFMDIGLPDEDGLSAIRKIRQNERGHSHTPIIALTAHATNEVKEECLNAGVDDFLTKPASFKDIFRCLEKYSS